MLLRSKFRSLAVLSFLAVGRLYSEGDHADRIILSLLQRSAPLAHVKVSQRVAVDPKLDLVLAFGSTRPIDPRWFWWAKDARIGLFLQDRTDATRVYQLTIEAGPNDDCAAVLERITAQDVVLSCSGEKSGIYVHEKFLYDIRAKALLKYFSYQPFGVSTVLAGPAGPQFVMSAGPKVLLVDLDPGSGEPRISGAAKMVPSPAAVTEPQLHFGPGKQFSLSAELVVKDRSGKEYEYSQSDLKTWKAARPDYGGFGQVQLAEGMGPHQLEGDRLWFGKSFYDSEGESGVGGFGYFDAVAKTYQIYSPPELAAWSVSAILVEPEFVWLGLFGRHEYGDNSGGLVRWDRKTQELRKFPSRLFFSQITRYNHSLYLSGMEGITVLQGEHLRDEQMNSYFVDLTSDGRYRLASRSGLTITQH